MAFVIAILLLVSMTASMADKCFRDQTIVTAISYLRPNTASTPNGVEGTVQMKQPETGGVTYFKISIRGLKPNSKHGFHIHANGDIINGGCNTAGGHYNPFDVAHGGPTDKIRHVGDLGNVYADQHGNVAVVKKDCMASLVGKDSIIGRAIVLHAKEDDLGHGGNAGSKTTGNAGARIACGVIIHG